MTNLPQLFRPLDQPVSSPQGNRSAAFDYLGSARIRYALYGLVSSLLFLATLFGARLRGEFNFILSDGRGYYAYLPSIVFDHDLDFSNQIRPDWPLKGFPFRLDQRSKGGAVKNKYPIGFALSLLPSFLVAHGISRLLFVLLSNSAFLDDGGYSVVYQLLNLAWIQGMGLMTMVLVDRMLVGRLRARPALVAATVLLFWLGTHYSYYYAVEPFMIHVVSTFWVTGTLWIVLRIDSRLQEASPGGWELFLLAWASAMAMICRLSNFFIIPFLLYLSFRLIKTGQVVIILRKIPFLLAGLIPLVLQFLVWQLTSGKMVKYTYDREGFIFWSSPKLWQTLFSPRHGLFTWTPLLFFSAGGIVRQLMKSKGWKEPLMLCFISSFLILWYQNSAWYGWWFGNAFGARAFLELASFYALGLYFFLDWAVQGSSRRRRLTALGILFCFIFNYTLMALYITNRIPHGKPLF